MNKNNININGIAQIILILGVIYLASLGADGWGWLLFIFFLISV